MEKLKLYLRESYNELVHNVTWPDWPTLQSNTVLVIVGSIIFAVLIFGMDGISQMATNLIYYRELFPDFN